MLVFLVLLWFCSGLASDMAARRWAWNRGVHLPADSLFAIVTGPVSGYLIVRFVREELE